MRVVAVFEKDPQSVLDYEINWTEWLKGDTIIVSQWTVEEGLIQDSNSFTDTITTVWFSGGTNQSRYEATNSIITGNGRAADRTIRIKCKEK